MDITFLGAAGEVGRSCVLICDTENIMLDCGMKIHASDTYPLQPPAAQIS